MRKISSFIAFFIGSISVLVMVSCTSVQSESTGSFTTAQPKTKISVTATPAPVNEVTQEAIKTALTKEEMLADYDQLWTDIYNYYPYLPVLEESFGVNVEALRQDNRQTLTTRIKDVEGFFTLLHNTLYQMNNFGHLQMVSPEVYATFYNPFNGDLYRQSPELFSLTQFDRDTFFNEQTETIYKYLNGSDSSSEAENVAPSDLSDEIAKLVSDLPDVDTRYYPEHSAAYFHFRTFNSPWLVERDENVVADYLASLGDKPVNHIIIDVTGNSGGDGNYWMMNIVSPLLDGDYEADFYMYFKDSAIAEKNLNRLEYIYKGSPTRIQDIPDSVRVPDFVQAYGLDTYVNDKIFFQFEPDAQQSQIAATTAKRWVLIDNGSFSASDSLAHFCKESGWATLVGDNTFGDGVGFQSIYTRLANTGLLVRMNIGIGANADGTMNAVVGTAPDIYNLKGETPLDTCLQIIAEEQELDK